MSRSNPDIESPEFKTWFGDSKVVDKRGRPLLVYHGSVSNNKFNAFSKEFFYSNEATGWFGEGFYFSTSLNTARSYGRHGHVITAYLSIQNPAIGVSSTSENVLVVNRVKDSDGALGYEWKNDDEKDWVEASNAEIKKIKSGRFLFSDIQPFVHQTGVEIVAPNSNQIWIVRNPKSMPDHVLIKDLQ